MANVTQALQEIRTLARQVASERLRPNVEKWDHDRAVPRTTLAELAELGFFGMLIPEAYGGMDFDIPTYTAALEELAWGEPSVAALVARGAVVADVVQRYGTEDQKRRRLERLASGDLMACAAIPEGSESGLNSVRAEPEASGWTLSGTHAFVVGGGIADLALFAAHGRAADEAGFFLVPTEATGYTVIEREVTMGFRALDVSRVRLDSVRVDADAVLGTGAPDAWIGTDIGRLSMAAIALGIAQAALDHATAYANEREQFGQKLRAFEGIQFKLADMAMRVHVTRSLIEATAASPTAMSTAVAKLFASEAAMWVTTQAVQVFGGYGYMRDYPVEKLMRDAKGTEIMEGANEQMRGIIARGLYA